MEKVVLVDEQDNNLGEMEKMEAHRKGVLHRAFSIFIFNDQNELLLQQRAAEKYHSGGLWTNTCCSHQRINETNIEAGKRRLMEEMGFATELEEKFNFIYRAELDQDLIEHELDHVLFGRYNDVADFNTDEVMAVKFVNLDDLEQDMQLRPDLYTAWFKIIFSKTKALISKMA
jgi:isopentenyl-diphosphate delta-isomerase